MRATSPALILSVLSLAGGCAATNPADGGQFGEESGAHCEVDTSTPLAMDEAGTEGITPQDLVDLAGGTHSGSLSWVDGSSTGLTVTVSDPSNARALTYVYVDDSGAEISTEMAMDCGPTVAVDANLAFATDDRVLAESWAVALETGTPGTIPLYRSLEDLAGTFDPADYADASYEATWAYLDATFADSGASDSGVADSGVHGTITGQGQQSSGSGADGTVSATVYPIATF